jgi:hypothetical protein
MESISLIRLCTKGDVRCGVTLRTGRCSGSTNTEPGAVATRSSTQPKTRISVKSVENPVRANVRTGRYRFRLRICLPT